MVNTMVNSMWCLSECVYYALDMVLIINKLHQNYYTSISNYCFDSSEPVSRSRNVAFPQEKETKEFPFALDWNEITRCVIIFPGPVVHVSLFTAASLAYRLLALVDPIVKWRGHAYAQFGVSKDLNISPAWRCNHFGNRPQTSTSNTHRTNFNQNTV